MSRRTESLTGGTGKKREQVEWKPNLHLFDNEGNFRLTIPEFLSWCKKHVSPAGYALVVDELRRVFGWEESAQ
jgi:hypothetical protein